MNRLTLPLLGLLIVPLLGVVSVTPTRAYGAENWQLGFSSTGVAPSTGAGFGFSGWCAFGGGVTSGSTGNCQLAQYFHGSAGSGFTCQEAIDVTAWDGSDGDFDISAATVSVTPASLPGPCLALFPGPAGFPVHTGIPAAAGHYNIGSIRGVVGEF
jgi:hypothetical protein